MNPRLVAAILLPFAAAGMQWLLWDYIKPYVWFLFFPAAFFSAWLSGLRGGIAGTAIGALLVWYVFIPPSFSFALEQPASAFSIVVFVVTGILFAVFHERLRQAQQWADSRFVSTFEQAAVGICHVSPEGRWLRVNRKFCEIVGYAPDELRDMEFLQLTHPDDRADDRDNLRRLLDGEVTSLSRQKRYLRKSGGVIWVNLTATLIRTAGGRPDYFVSVYEDITARKQTEFALRESEERFRRLFDQAPLPLAFIDHEGRIVTLNKRFQLVFGWTTAEIPSVEQWWPLAYPDLGYRTEVVAVWSAAVAKAAATGIDVPMREFLVSCKGGETRTMEISGIVLPEGLLVVFFDVSERRQAENARAAQANELKRRNEELERLDRAAVGRELQMIELKRQIDALSHELGRQAPFDLSFADLPAEPDAKP